MSASEVLPGNSSRNLRLAIGAIFKNEAPYVLEWVAFHRAVGIDHFFVADNGSDDGTTEILADLDRAGIVTHIPFPGTPGQAPQLPAYAEIMRRHRGDTDFIAFIDADEFLLPTDGETSIRPVVSDLAQMPDLGAIAINWACFGSSGHEKQSDDLVTRRFSKRAEQNLIQNHHYKSIVRSTAWLRNHGTPHMFVLKPTFRLFRTDGQAVQDHVARGAGLSQEVCWDRIRLNHYVVKSRQEFFERKGPRGRATVVGGTKGAGYFSTHDRNDVTDPMPQRFLDATKREMANLLELMKAGTAHKRPQILRGAVDVIKIDGTIASVIGWALLKNGDTAPFITLKIGSYTVPKPRLNRIKRPDVAKIHHAASDAGFRISFDLLDLPDEAFASDDIEVNAGTTAACSDFKIATGAVRWPNRAAEQARGSSIQKTTVRRVSFLNTDEKREIFVPPCKTGNLLLRYFTAHRLYSSVPNSQIVGFQIPELNLNFQKEGETTYINPIKLGQVHYIDVLDIAYKLRYRLNDACIFNAYAHRIEYFEEYIDYFRSSLASNELGYPTNENDLIISVRSGDILEGLHPDYMPIPISYYSHIIKETNLSPVFVGQIEKNWYTDALRRSFPEARFIGGSWIQDFQTIRNAKNIVLSVSSFAWVAAWLSQRAQRIYVPVVGMLNPAQRADINLLPKGDPRYIFDFFPVMKYEASRAQKSMIVDGDALFLTKTG